MSGKSLEAAANWIREKQERVPLFVTLVEPKSYATLPSQALRRYLIPSDFISLRKYFSWRPRALAAAVRLPSDCWSARRTSSRRWEFTASRYERFSPRGLISA